MEVVGLLEVRQRMELEAAAGEVLKHQLAAAEGELVTNRGKAPGWPVARVSAQLEEHQRHS
jgi:hypothetical protein